MESETAIYPLELPVSLAHPRLEEFCADLRCQGDPILAPMADELLPIENCYWNVLYKVENQGGEIMFGWMIRQWPGLYLAAEHHAVWKRPDGSIIDVTQRRPETVEPTTFALDSVQDFDVSASPNIPIEYLRLTEDSRVTELIELSGKMSCVTQGVNCFLANELGYLNDAQMAIARGETPEAIHMTAEQLNRYKQLVLRGTQFRQAIGETIHSLLTRPPNQFTLQRRQSPGS
jgi:hypothetical protein